MEQTDKTIQLQTCAKFYENGRMTQKTDLKIILTLKSIQGNMAGVCPGTFFKGSKVDRFQMFVVNRIAHLTENNTR